MSEHKAMLDIIELGRLRDQLASRDQTIVDLRKELEILRVAMDSVEGSLRRETRVLGDVMRQRDSHKSRAEAAERREIRMRRAIENVLSHDCCGTCSTMLAASLTPGEGEKP